MSIKYERFFEVPLNYLHRYYPKLRDLGYSSEAVASQLNIPKDWYNWSRFWLNYQKNPHVLVNKSDIEWLDTLIGEVQYRINKGMLIYCEHMNGLYGKDETVNRLILLSEYGDLSCHRIGALYALKLLRLKDQRIFDLCENLAISDHNPDVRYQAVNVLIENFKDISLKVLKWVIDFEVSEEVFHKILKDLDDYSNKYLEHLIRSRLESEIKRDKLVKKIDKEFYGSFNVLIID
ncbi:MAG: hypothetical protein GF353_20415 [Candidatus Lokiarchaeota archaeon]|nr:hypothetical protein [Candidatus Lokiarchaeota archaeon]